MQVKLRILRGPNEGKEVRIPTPKCIIGRGDGCHLKAQSDAVSRQHCVIETVGSEVTIRDLNSRNGTIVNDERINGAVTLLSGDILHVGPLEFEIIVEIEVDAKSKHSPVSNAKDVLERTALTSGSNMDAGKVNKWLAEADAKKSPETKQFKLDETDLGEGAKPQTSIPLTAEQQAKLKAEEEARLKAEEEARKKAEAEKKKPSKLPPVPTSMSKNSRQAADEFLKRMFRK